MPTRPSKPPLSSELWNRGKKLVVLEPECLTIRSGMSKKKRD